MWQKKKWTIVAVLAAVVVLSVGTIAGVAYAQSGTTPPGTSPEKTMLGRVATILGIDQKKVEDAFAKAGRDMRDEALSNRLKGLVDQGKMTPQQADQYKQWSQSRPNIPGLESPGPMGFRGFPGPARPPAPPPASVAPKSS